MESELSKQEMIDYVKNHDLSSLIREGEPAELPPPNEREVMAVRTVRLPARTYEQLQRFADQRSVGTSVLMREIIEQWVAAQLSADKSEDVVPVAELVAFLRRAARPAA